MDIVVPYVRRPDWPAHDVLVAELRAAAERTATDGDRLEVVEFRELDEERRAQARVAVIDGPTAAQLASLPSLIWVQSTWAGVEEILPAVPDDVAVVRMIDPQLGRTMAEAVLAWTLYLHRDMPRYAAQQARHEWAEHPLVRTSDRRVGVLGLGALGSVAARRLAEHGFDVAGWSRTPKSVESVESFAGDAGLALLLERSDIVVSLLPDTPDTRGLLGADAFGRMPAGASVVNFGRGPTIDDDALLSALDSGRLEHAVLDVFVTEPLPGDHPFWDHARVTVLPHISGPTSPDTAAGIAIGNIRRWLTAGELPSDGLVDRARGY